MDTTSTPAKRFPLSSRELFVIGGLAVLVFAIYARTTHFGFIDLDDNEYVFNNPFIKDGLNWASIKWSFTAFHAANWHPLTWLSHALDVQVAGLNAGWHHGVNVALHLINSILLFLLFSRMTGRFWESAVLAGLFAVHPAHVESVAWVAERKDVLSTLFWLLTMGAYFRFVKTTDPISPTNREPAESGLSGRRRSGKRKVALPENRPSPFAGLWTPSYLWVIILFALGLMAKPMLVTLPFVLLLCDIWPLNRWRSLRDFRPLVLEKLPLFLLVFVSCVLTVMAQKAGGAVQSVQAFPLPTRVVNSVLAYAKYVVMMFYPARLTVLYPYPTDFPIWRIAGAGLIVLGVSALCYYQREQRKYLLVGWLWFLGTLVPVIGLVQVGSQPLAERYTYIPYIGLFIMLVWGLADLFRNLGLDLRLAFAAFLVVVIVFGALSFRQVGFWRDDETAYRHALDVTQRNFLISYNLCHLLMTRDRLDEAEPFCRDSIQFAPNYVEAYNTLGIIQLKRQQYPAAEQNFLETVRRSPGYALAYANLANAQILEGKPEAGEASLQKAVQLSAGAVPPTLFAQSLTELIAAYAKEDRKEKVAENLGRLLYLTPQNTAARKQLALTLFQLKRFDEAQAQIRIILGQNPNDAEAFNLYGTILMGKGEPTEAIRQFEHALQIKPDLAEAKENLARAQGGK